MKKLAIIFIILSILSSCMNLEKQKSKVENQSREDTVISSDAYTYLAELFWVDTKTVSGASAAFGLVNANVKSILIHGIPEKMMEDYNDGDVVEITYERQMLSTGEEKIVLTHINHSTGLYEHEYYLNDLIDFEVREITIEKKVHFTNEVSKITINDPNKINGFLNGLNKVPIYTDYVYQNFGDTITYTVTFIGGDHQMILMKIDDSVCEIDKDVSHMVYGYHRTNKHIGMYSCT